MASRDGGSCHRNFQTCNPTKQYKFKWAIENYSTLCNGTELRSPDFNPMGGSVWYTKLRKEYIHFKNCIILAFYNSNAKSLKLSIVVRILNINGICFSVPTIYSYHIENACASFYFSIEKLFYNPKTDTFMESFYSTVDFPEDFLVLECEMKFSRYEISTETVNFVVQPSSKNDSDVLSCDLLKLYESAAGSDITFKIRGKRLQAHKAILIARSEVFAKMFLKEMNENKTREIEISDITLPVFKTFLEYLYTGISPKIDDLRTAKRLYHVANKYHVVSLKNEVLNFYCACYGK